MSSAPYPPLGHSPVSASAVAAKVPTVLIAESDPVALQFCESALSREGYPLVVARSPREVWDSICMHQPAVIVLGGLEPDAEFDLLSAVKGSPETAGIPLVRLLEASALSADCTDEVLIMPFTPRELAIQVRASWRLRRKDLELQRVGQDLHVTARATQHMMNCSLDAICSVDAKGRFVAVSKAAERLWGYSREQLLGTRWLDIVHPEEIDRTESEIGAIMAGRECFDFENRIVHVDGRVLTMSWSAYWSEPDQTMYCVARDVTEARVAEDALKRMGQRLQRTLESMTDAFFLLDTTWKFAYLNGEAERLLQGWREDLVHQNIWDEYPKLAETEIFRHFHQCLAQNTPAHFELFVPPFGRWFQVHVFPSEQGLAVYFRDTTDRRRSEDMLHESHERFLNVVRATNHVVWDWDFAENEVWWADGFENRLGYNTAQIDPKSGFWFDHIHPDDKDRVYQGLCKCIESSMRTWSDEYRFRRSDGTYAYVHDRGYIVHDADGKPIRAVGGLVDVSVKHEQTTRLRESEARFRLLADNVDDAFWIIDAQTHQPIYVNRAFHQMCGSSADAPLAEDAFPSSIHPADRERVTLHGFDQSLGFNGEYRILRPDGSTIWVWARMVPVRDSLGVLTRIVGIARDITERKKSEELIFEQAALLDNAQEAIFVVDLDNHVLFWNRSAERLYGPGAAEVVGRPFVSHAEGKDEAHRAARERVLEQGEWMGELTERTAQGRTIVVEAHWTLVRDPEGKPKSILCINTDVTERKRLESQVLRAQRLESIGTLAGGIAHDLNNVLTPIIMSIDLLKRKSFDQDSLEILELIDSSAHRGAEMVGQVLSFARGVEGERISVQPRHLIKEVEKIVAETFPKKIQLKMVSRAELWSVVGDPTQLHQVLLNLCVNARDAMPGGGTLKLCVSNVLVDENYAAMNIDAKVGPHVLIEVHDNGSGMPPDLLDKIFDPFFTTKDFGKGTGLGLSTSLAIVKSHGGFIRVYSEVGRGSHFSVYLPASVEQGDADVLVAKQQPRCGNGELVLLIDDELPIRTVAQQTLEAHGYQVILATDGAEAIAIYAQRQREIAIVFTDMMMPVMDGAAAIEVLMRMNPEVKIIAASGMKRGLTQAHPNVRAFLNKPYSTEELLEALANALRGPMAQAQKEMRR